MIDASNFLVVLVCKLVSFGSVFLGLLDLCFDLLLIASNNVCVIWIFCCSRFEFGFCCLLGGFWCLIAIR